MSAVPLAERSAQDVFLGGTFPAADALGCSSGKKVSMPLFLHLVSYSPEAWQALATTPEDRVEAVRPAIEKLGGRIKSWFAFGEYDVYVISEMPNSVSAAAIAIAFAGGVYKSVQSSPLLTAEEAVEMINKAKESGHKPPYDRCSRRVSRGSGTRPVRSRSI